MLTARRPGMVRANAHAKGALGSKQERSYSPLACHPKGGSVQQRGLKDAGATPLPNGTLSDTALLPLFPDRQANAGCPKRAKREPPDPPIDVTADEQPRTSSSTYGYFWSFWYGSPSLPLGGPGEAVKQLLNCQSSIIMRPVRRVHLYFVYYTAQA